MRIYTRRGDTGETGLLGGARIRKDDIRIEAIGTVDELNTVIGWAQAACKHVPEWLPAVQVTLFDIGAQLASPQQTKQAADTAIEASHVEQLEQWIDNIEEQLPPLRHFVLPGGCELAARLHMARAVARRAERAVLRLDEQHSVDPIILQYINRLSDLLFVAARQANVEANTEDIPYRAPS